MTAAPVILVLSALGMETALRIKADLPEASIHGLEGRVVGADVPFAQFWRDHPPALSDGPSNHRPVLCRHYHPLIGFSA